MFKRLLTSALVFGMAALAPPAKAQTFCLPRPALVGELGRVFGETPLAAGLRPPGEIFEFWVRPDGGSWTLVLTRADGLACVIASGPAWIPSPATAATAEGAEG